MGNVAERDIVRLLSRGDVERLLDLRACMDAVERAFRTRAEGAEVRTGVLGIHVDGGGFHAKAAAMHAGNPERFYFAAKLNANFPGNPARRGRPTIQGLLMLFDGTAGTPLCVMDSLGLTILRTAAATGVAARHLALAGARTATIIGCGAQAEAQLAAVHVARPLARAFAYDMDSARSSLFAQGAASRLGIPVEPVTDLVRATRASQIVVTCTPARRPFLGLRHVAPGTLVAAVGADWEEKSEIEPALMRDAAVVVDHLEQCATIGDLHHALEAGAMTRAQVRSELGEAISNPARGRRSEDEIVVFDSTGVALQDVAAAVVVYEAAIRQNAGVHEAFAFSAV